jgi:dihydropteroate synthase
MRGQECVLGQRTWLMGVLNVTPDSFSDGGCHLDAQTAVARGLAMFSAGADVVDVGGESTRPGGAARVDAQTELDRVIPVVRALRERSAGWISVDTTKAAVAQAAIETGADMINDVSALRFDPQMAPLLARSGVPVVLMHSRGDFTEMHTQQHYSDVAGEVAAELETALAYAEQAGITRSQTLLDPGLGFAKEAAHSLAALDRLDELAALDRPLLVGPSRKSFIGLTLERPVGERLMGTAAAVAAAVLGGAHMVRVHDVEAMLDVVRISDALRGQARC